MTPNERGFAAYEFGECEGEIYADKENPFVTLADRSEWFKGFQEAYELYEGGNVTQDRNTA